ncbi:MAG: hypothetical protein IH616_19905 [Gemmatimonadales bacterium]|jgi:hypothetical protein|nr:hypothetical protein [Gemmatimonadales bacterium]
MTKDSDGKPQSSRFDPPWSQIKARQMGELEIGEAKWDVLLEISTDPADRVVHGRIHFISGNTHRLSSWIFLEWSEKDVEARFREFGSGRNLWDLLKSLE